MAGPTVTLEFAGDEKKLTGAMDRVGAAGKAMASKVDDSSKTMAGASTRFDSAGEAADGAEGKFMGFHDVLDGVKGAFETLSDPSASFTDKLIGLGQAGADVAGGMASFLIPAFQGLWTRLTESTAATWLSTAATSAWGAVTKGVTIASAALNAVIKANPIMFLVGLIVILVGAFLALWTRSEAFRNFFIGMWNGIKTAVVSVVGAVKAAWNGVVSFFSDFPGKIGRALGSLGSIISGAFKGALNIAIDVVNWGIDRINDLIYGVNLVNPFSDIPSIPHLNKLHTGGVVPGMPGSEQLMVLQAGERVTPAGQGGGGGATVTFAGDTSSAFATAFMGLVRTGAIQVGA